MDNPLIRRLSAFEALTDAEEQALRKLCASPVKRGAGASLIKEGDRPEAVFLLLSGWAARYAYTSTGTRQITAFMLPGDLCDSHAFILDEMDHAISLLSDASVVAIPKEAILRITEEFPKIARAFWWSTLVAEAIMRKWLINIGQSNSYKRLAHLFCELWFRLHEVGLTDDGHFSMPLTQEQIADALGLTSVHLNRTLQRMRSDGLIDLSLRNLTILDSRRMREIAGFDPRYLHIQRKS